jgi:hypothetical protein
MTQIEIFRPRTIEKIEKFPTKTIDTDITEVAEQMIDISGNLYVITKKDLARRFTFNEALLICEVFQAWIDTFEINDYKTYILMNIDDAILYNFADTRFNVKKDILLSKINSMSQLECLTIMLMGFEAMNCKISEENFSEVVNEVFGIDK